MAPAQPLRLSSGHSRTYKTTITKRWPCRATLWRANGRRLRTSEWRWAAHRETPCAQPNVNGGVAWHIPGATRGSGPKGTPSALVERRRLRAGQGRIVLLWAPPPLRPTARDASVHDVTHDRRTAPGGGRPVAEGGGGGGGFPVRTICILIRSPPVVQVLVERGAVEIWASAAWGRVALVGHAGTCSGPCRRVCVCVCVP